MAAAVIKRAEISDCGRYRYTLERVWSEDVSPVLFVMLNPSTADAELDDPTIRKCVKFARSWGWGGLLVGNLFAYRATKPQELASFEGDRVGPDNDRWLRELARRAGSVVVAWGAQGIATTRATEVTELLEHSHVQRLPLHALAVNANGSPKHPLYVRDDTYATRWPR